jgi:hypothetical protein
MTEKFISRQNFLFFSLTEMSFNDENKYIGIGILDNVIVFDEFENQLNTLYERMTEEYNLDNLEDDEEYYSIDEELIDTTASY